MRLPFGDSSPCPPASVWLSDLLLDSYEGCGPLMPWNFCESWNHMEPVEAIIVQVCFVLIRQVSQRAAPAQAITMTPWLLYKHPIFVSSVMGTDSTSSCVHVPDFHLDSLDTFACHDDGHGGQACVHGLVDFGGCPWVISCAQFTPSISVVHSVQSSTNRCFACSAAALQSAQSPGCHRVLS